MTIPVLLRALSATRLNGLSPQRSNPCRGFELMKIGRPRCAPRRLFRIDAKSAAALWHR
jgi:hypothetical protein